MASTNPNRAAHVPVDSPQANEVAVLLEVTIQQIRASRRRLEAQKMIDQGDEDALIYLETAEMHLKAAKFRLAGAAEMPSRTGRAA